MRNIDLHRNARQPAILRFVHPHNSVIVVGTAVVQLSQTPIPCLSVLCQSDNANGGIICVGGLECTITTGVQLTGGQAMLFYADQMAGMDAVMRSVMGLGLEGLAGIQAGVSQPQVLKVISLTSLRAVATAAGQLLRIQWMTWAD